MLRISFIAAFFISVLMACNSDQKSGAQTAPMTEQSAVTKTEVKKKKNILFFGTSLTAGYGLDDPSEAYPALIQDKIDSLGLPYQVINGGLSGETSADGLSRIDWLLKQSVDIFVLELGANDGLRGLPVQQTSANLQAIINKVKRKYPNALLVLEGMQMPPSMGATYTKDFKEVFSDLAKKNDMVFVPFLLEGVGGVSKLNQEDGIHPTKEGEKILANNVWQKLEPVLHE